MNRHERRAQAKANAKAGRAAHAPQALAVLHAAVLKHALDGRFLEATSTCEQALSLDPDNADTMHLMGMVNLEARQLAHAVEWTSRAISKAPKPAYFATLGLALSDLGRHEDALKAFDTALQLKGDDAQLWWQKGGALIAAGRTPEALAAFEQTLKLDPRHGDAAYKCGHLLHGLERFEEALAYLDRSAALQPRHALTWQMRALVLKDLNRLDEALADNRRAIALDPANPDTSGNLGAVLQAQGRIEEALSSYERALQIRPDSPRMITNRASALAELGRLDEAMADYRRALAIDPAFAEAAWNLALLQLQLGDFEEGLKGREVRWKFPKELTPSYPKLSAPIWLGEQPIAGKTVLVCADEGFGDSIQFARYLPLLAERGARVVLVVEAPLCPLLSGVEGVAQCLPKHPGTVLPAFDFHIPFTCMPLAFKTRLDSISARVPYLPPPAADRVQAFESRLDAHEKLRVGLVWSGNPKHQNDRNRSVPLATLSRLVAIDATFVSLQKDPRPRDAETLRALPEIIDLTADLTDFAATAALIACLDLVISVDTSVAHLAGALGKPVWLLLPHVPDFRWLIGREDSPWYPKHRLFAQSATREYDSVLDRVRVELSELAKAFVRARRGE
ncbi:MAG TPA: tetratricopeptide repeat-containing glycosyltransferase family protein [Bradyrhizobium sp.]|uniref:tetratricopeptide repeat-containing glycosyltransferase family protein n=1 Tax=Bradyrhizobium sp. TaxID=376 RepID=UPI002BDC4DCA|nr:tetratricopeptide repeat-containing glycosyltransferase family protein [Bradyrhizobium sp.]HLZ06663.1 tetratricopeptide repeat-containing glycosyltransferase family protein [Bradyrhizobium sp.]